jgi:hypothetical protein
MIILSKEQVLMLHERLMEATGEIGAEDILQWIIEHQK